jgi:type IV secretion system protein TrbF
MRYLVRDGTRVGEENPRNRDTASQAQTTAGVDERVHRGRAEFHSMFADLAKGKRNWQLTSFGLLGLTSVLAIGLVTLATQSRITPYVVEVDRLGRAQAIAAADRIDPADQRVTVAQLASFIRDIRTVLPDPAAQTDLVRRAYAFVDQGAATFLSQYYDASPENDPRLLGKELTRLVEVTSILPVPTASKAQGSATWKVSWTETSFAKATGGMPAEAAWEGYLTTRTVPPATVERVTLNPLGLYITSINWTQISTRSRPAAGQDTAAAPAASTGGAVR